MGRNAIVTFTIGERYVETFKQFKPSWQKYCAKYDIDLIELHEPLVPELTEGKYIIAQKILICSQEWSAKYDKIAWIDSDIYISPNAKNIFDAVTEGKIGMVNDDPYGDYDYRKYTWEKKGWGTDTPEDLRNINKYQKDYGFWREDFKQSGMIDSNPGVMVFQPKYHADYLKGLFDTMIEKIKEIPERDEFGRRMHFDGWVWYYFQNDDKLEFIDHRFNMVWPIYRTMHYEPFDTREELIIPMKNFIEKAYFVHFTDMEDVSVFQHVKDVFLEAPPTSLMIRYKEGTGLPWLLSKWTRAKKFENIWIVTTSDEANYFLQMAYPRQQYAWRVPEFYQIVDKGPEITGRTIVCDSDWIENIPYDYFVKLQATDVNEHPDKIRVVVPPQEASASSDRPSEDLVPDSS
jgi:hypothetical protein